MKTTKVIILNENQEETEIEIPSLESLKDCINKLEKTLLKMERKFKIEKLLNEK